LIYRFGVGATAGPLLGGVFTDLVTWRWCFYFNLPVGGVTLFAMVLFFRPPKNHALSQKSILYRIGELDLIGNGILLAASIMLFLALQYTEKQIPWSSALIVGLLVGAGLTFITFCVWQWWKADGALIPPRILEQRSVGTSCIIGFFIYAAILIQTYYLPIWFQAVKGYTAIRSGVAMIPYVAANAISSVLAGVFVSKNGYFTVPAIIGCAIGTVGCGLIATFTPSTSSATWIGYEILASAGIGMAIQQGFSAVQIVLPLDEVAIGTAAIVAFQSLGGAVFVSVGNTILQNVLLSASHHDQLPGVDIQAVIKGGASEFRKKVPPQAIPQLIVIYNKALQKVFIAAIPMAGLAFVSCMFLEWKSVKGRKLADEEAEGRKGREELERKILENHGMNTKPVRHPQDSMEGGHMEHNADKEAGIGAASPAASIGRGAGIGR
jgi:MFS family permease